ncbi:MAG: CinA family nicotinamide mononucleotide deamidase-related protein [Pirellulales bacterium]|nr:CinA family nicotinamide mononucleotide deamidase-related protein [Pirellulales bacterium]
MLAEVISIGDELTTGQRLDTNSQWLSERLCELGARVLFHSTVADDLEANIRVFREAADRADVVVSTGGLGPTEDDLTRQALTGVLGVELVLDQASLDHIRDLFARFMRDMPERNVVQAMFPAGTRPIFNPAGTAPGIDVEIPRPGRTPCRIFALPGVPAEMREIWQAYVAPAIAATSGGRVIRHRRIKCFGLGESHVEAKLPDLIRRGREPSVGITVSGATITLRITAAGSSSEACLASMEDTVRTIYDCLGEVVFGEEDDELEHAVARLLADEGKTLAVAEWGTGGLVAHWLSDLPEATPLFVGGSVIRNAAALRGLMANADLLLAQHGPASGPVAEAMAAACRANFHADYALAISDFPEFDPKAAEPKRVYYALSSPVATLVRSVPFAGHPSILKVRSAKQALNLVRLALLRQDQAGT